LQAVQEHTRAADGAQQVLCLDSRVRLAQARDLLLDEGAVSRIDGGQCVPIMFKVQAQSGLLLLFKVEGALPGE
jgi:hypothetical protein